VARTQEERKAETRARLLTAAAGLFADRGIDAVSVDAVADGAERTSGAVYAHFGSKQGLLLALADEWTQSLVTVIGAEFDLAADVDARVASVARNVVTEPSEATRRLLLLEHELWLRAARDESVAAAMRARRRDAHERLTRGLAAWMEQGFIPRTTPPDEMADALQALVLGLVMQHRVDPEGLELGAVERAIGDVLGVEVRTPQRV